MDIPLPDDPPCNPEVPPETEVNITENVDAVSDEESPEIADSEDEPPPVDSPISNDELPIADLDDASVQSSSLEDEQEVAEIPVLSEDNSSSDVPPEIETPQNETTEIEVPDVPTSPENEVPDITETPLPKSDLIVESKPVTPIESSSIIGFLEDIPIPADIDRYSPSLPNEDDPPDLKPDLSSIALPSGPPKVATVPTVSVLGKEAAKKRLLAFSLTKQSLQAQKKLKTSLSENVAVKDIKDNSETKSLAGKKKKKGVFDKARDTISEIEEIKRRENEVRESMHILYPMWGSSDSKMPPVPSLYIPETPEKSERIDNMVEKFIAKKSLKDQKELERLERQRIEKEEERRRKREKREKERRRFSPKNWAEFTKCGLKAYHYRRVKSKREKMSDSKRSHDREDKGHPRKLNLFETPMVIKSPFIALSICNDHVKFPSWSLKYTSTRPRIPYSFNPKADRISCHISRKEMLSSLPDDILNIVKGFFNTTSLKSGVSLPALSQ